LTVEHRLALLIEDADVQGAGMSVDAAVKWVLLGVESHEVSSFLVTFPTIRIPLGYAEEGTSISINPVERTGHTTGFLSKRVSVACGPPLTGSVRCRACV
jgi:hypothetical protein